jgi:hypothetical protein
MDHKSEIDSTASAALEIVGRIYDAALQPALWPAVLEHIVEYIGGTRGILFTSLLAIHDGGFVFAHRLPASFVQQWNDKYI